MSENIFSGGVLAGAIWSFTIMAMCVIIAIDINLVVGMCCLLVHILGTSIMALENKQTKKYIKNLGKARFK